MYKSVHELNQEELEELTQTYMDNNNLDEVSYEEVKEYYSGVSFTKDDFWCNLKD